MHACLLVCVCQCVCYCMYTNVFVVCECICICFIVYVVHVRLFVCHHVCDDIYNLMHLCVSVQQCFCVSMFVLLCTF